MMAEELDTVTARQLSRDVRDLSLLVAKLEGSISRWGPLVESHVLGIAQLDNRATRLEDWRTGLEKRLTEEKAAKDKDEEARIKEQTERTRTFQWTIGISCTLIVVLLSFLSFMLSHVTFK